MRMCAARRNYAAVQLKRTEFLVRCFSLIYSFLVDSHGRRSARTPRHPEWQTLSADTRPHARERDHAMIEPLHTFLIPRSNPQQSSCGDLNARLYAAATE